MCHILKVYSVYSLVINDEVCFGFGKNLLWASHFIGPVLKIKPEIYIWICPSDLSHICFHHSTLS